MSHGFRSKEKGVYISNLDVLVNKARSLRDSIPTTYLKHESFQDNFGRFLVKLMDAQFYLDEMNRECHGVEGEYVLDIIDITQESSEK